MAKPEHLAILQHGGVDEWNMWRQANPATRPTLVEADLHSAKLWDADLSEADLNWADLHGADISRVNLSGARLFKANLSGANLSGANLNRAYLSRADLRRATCIQTHFYQAVFVNTNLEGADLTGAYIYGISAWDLQLTGAVQRDLVITPEDATSRITVDDLEVAQFIYLLLNNRQVRKVIDTITSKVVLILGRFTPERKPVLDAVREELRNRNYLPVLFDFEKPSNRDYTETIRLLAGMSKFVIADLSGARSIQQELQAIIPDFELPVVPIIQQGERPWPIFESHQRADHVLPIVQYRDSDEFMANFGKVVVLRAEKKYDAIILRKAKHKIEMLSVDDVLDGD